MLAGPLTCVRWIWLLKADGCSPVCACHILFVHSRRDCDHEWSQGGLPSREWRFRMGLEGQSCLSYWSLISSHTWGRVATRGQQPFRAAALSCWAVPFGRLSAVQQVCSQDPRAMHVLAWSRVELPCTVQGCRWLVLPLQRPCALNRFCVLQIDRLISYGADVLKPVVLTQGERTAVGTAVDYGYFKFYQVWLCSLSQVPLRPGFSWVDLGVHSQGWSSRTEDLMMANMCFGHL